MRRSVGLFAWALLGMTAIAGAADAPKGITNLPLIFSDDFESGSSSSWVATDPAAWKIEKTDKGHVLSQFGKSNTKTPVRSPSKATPPSISLAKFAPLAPS